MSLPPPNAAPLTRRAWLEACFRPLQAATSVARSEAKPSGTAKPAQVAVIAGRQCLAYQNNFCTTCSERCPVPGAIVIEKGFPRVVPQVCTGCEICHQVCPAPENAILMVPRRLTGSAPNSQSSRTA
jgi:Na+-translocating ferredoxin:NAD+ oxidoreductase RNF subunit RnfB